MKIYPENNNSRSSFSSASKINTPVVAKQNKFSFLKVN